MKKIFDFLLFSNIYISICAAFLCLFSFSVLDVKIQWDIILLVFFSTLSAYNFHRLRGIRKSNSSNRRIEWMKRNHSFSFYLTITSFLAAVTCYFLLPNPTMIFLLPLTLICLWYAVGLLKHGKFDKPLREVPFLKIFLISFVWVGACLMLPAVSLFGFDILSNFDLQLSAFAFGSFVLSLTLPFDIRDIKDDKTFDLYTIPSSIGTNKTKLLSIIGFLLSGLIFTALHTQESVSLISLLAFASTCIVSVLMVMFSSPNKSEYYYSFLLESPLIFPFLFLQLFQLFLS